MDGNKLKFKKDELRLTYKSKRSEKCQFWATGGKKMFQNWGDGVVNSTGTREPSGLSCGGRTTCASTFFCVFGFSIESLVPWEMPSGRMIMAPLALTVCVKPLI